MESAVSSGMGQGALDEGVNHDNQDHDKQPTVPLTAITAVNLNVEWPGQRTLTDEKVVVLENSVLFDFV